MKYIIISTMTNNFGLKGFYNSQETGLAKALVNLGNDVDILKIVNDLSCNIKIEETSNNVRLIQTKGFKIGTNGFIRMKNISTMYDRCIQFSDTQLSVPHIYRWCIRNEIKYIPYIGVLQSHSDNKIIRTLIDIHFHSNLKVYKKCNCFAKNKEIYIQLIRKKLDKVTLAPVGIDLSLLYSDFEEADLKVLRKKWFIKDNEKVILFIGRLVEEKRPLDILNIYKKLIVKYPDYKLIMVGKGMLELDIRNFVKENYLQDSVKCIDEIKNQDVWELYRVCEYFINFNKEEIFGMVLLEAMYYGCIVIATEAPGPNLIIENNKSGYLIKEDVEILDILDKPIANEMIKNAHDRILNEFVWEKTAKKIHDN